MDRLKRRIKSVAGGKKAGAQLDLALIERLERTQALEGNFSHESYPAGKISECLDACQRVLSQLAQSPQTSVLARQIEQRTQAHQALSQELSDFLRDASALSREILTLTAAAKPLQQMGIGAGDRNALRETLSQRAQALQQRRDAYEAQAQAMDARVRDMVGGVDALRKNLILFVRQRIPGP